MMNTHEIASFLDTLHVRSKAARYIRATIYRMHTGRWPTLRAISMRREGQEIIEVATWSRHVGSKPFLVVQWSLKEVHFAWWTYRTLGEAIEQSARTLSVDAAQHVFRS